MFMIASIFYSCGLFLLHKHTLCNRVDDCVNMPNVSFFNLSKVRHFLDFQIIKRTFYIINAFCCYVSIDQGSLYIRMPQEFLDIR